MVRLTLQQSKQTPTASLAPQYTIHTMGWEVHKARRSTSNFSLLECGSTLAVVYLVLDCGHCKDRQALPLQQEDHPIIGRVMLAQCPICNSSTCMMLSLQYELVHRHMFCMSQAKHFTSIQCASTILRLSSSLAEVLELLCIHYINVLAYYTFTEEGNLTSHMAVHAQQSDRM